MVEFKDNDQGKHDLLMLMINSVDYYNLISGKMKVTSTYLDNMSNLEYEFQINIPEYKSYYFLNYYISLLYIFTIQIYLTTFIY